MASVADSRPLRFAAILAFAGAIVAYLPFLLLPHISDDYLQIDLARQYGTPSGWLELARDVLYRCRATSLVVTALVDRLFGMSPLAHNVTNLLVHLFNCYLVLLLGSWRRIGYRISSAAAVFFAVYEGHQEAVVWNAALPELLVFTFACGTLLLWIRWVQTGNEACLPAVTGAFLLALLSKESAVVVVPMMLFVALVERKVTRRSLLMIGFLGAMCAAYAFMIFAASQNHLHLNDGTFDWKSAFPRTIANSIGRMLWIWGALALAVLLRILPWMSMRFIAGCMLFMAAALVPYSFLSYMDRVPSRHTYLPSAALAVLAGAAFIAVQHRFQDRRRWIPHALLAVFLIHNCGYLWIKKLPQYQRRAAPTESIISFARQAKAVEVHCFPYPLEVAQRAVAMSFSAPAPLILAKGEPRLRGITAVPYCDSDKP